MVSLAKKALLDERLQREACRLVEAAGSYQLRPIQVLYRLTEFKNGFPVPQKLEDVEGATIDCLLGLELIRRTIGGYEMNCRFGEFLEDRLLLWDSSNDDEEQYIPAPMQRELQENLRD